MSRDVELKAYIDLDSNGSFANDGEDISAYVISANWQLGFIKSFTSVARDTTATLVVENLNGEFSLGSVTALNGLLTGRPIRLQTVLDGVTRDAYYGWVRNVRPDPGIYSGNRAKIECYGWLQKITNKEVKLPILVNFRTDEIMQAVIQNMAVYPPGFAGYWQIGRSRLNQTTKLGAISKFFVAEQGRTVLPISGDFGTRKGLAVLTQIAEQEGGKLFVGPDGKIYFWNRHHIFNLGIAPADAVYDNTMKGLEPEDSIDVVNRYVVPFQTIKVSFAPEVVGFVDDTMELDAGETISITITYSGQGEGIKVSGQKAIAPLASTDFIATAEDGTDASAFIATAITSESSSSCTVRFSNKGPLKVYLDSVQVRAIKITDYGRGSEKFDDATSIANLRTINEQTYSTPMVSQADALAMAKFQLQMRQLTGVAKTMTPEPYLSDADMLNAVSLTIGNSIHIKESKTGIDRRHTIIGGKYSFLQGGIFGVTWYVEPDPSVRVWRLGNTTYSRLGKSTRPLAF